jgi:ubiquinone/menaquinone biosynthesis C-methylase UbiE
MDAPCENFITDITECFRKHLFDKAREFGFIEPKRTDWINYMLSSAEKDEFFSAVLPDLGLNEGNRDCVLDIGCGYGNLLLALASRFKHVHGIEIMPERVEWARKRIPTAEVVCASATRLAWPDDWFDLVISTDVFEHIPVAQQVAAASEMFRVTKRGGQGFVKVPNRFQLVDEHNYVRFATWFPDFLRRRYVQFMSRNPYVQCWERTGRGWKRLFERAGFQVLIKPIATRYVLFPCGYHVFLRKPPFDFGV